MSNDLVALLVFIITCIIGILIVFNDKNKDDSE